MERDLYFHLGQVVGAEAALLLKSWVKADSLGNTNYTTELVSIMGSLVFPACGN